VFRGGFQDEKYLDFERNYKWTAHEAWMRVLDKASYRVLLEEGAFVEIAMRAVRIESATNLLFSFEKMALRDAVRFESGARAFAQGLYDFLHGSGGIRERFDRWVDVVARLPRRQTRVLTWPVVTVFGFIAVPRRHIFLKPNVTRFAARRYEFDFAYRSRPNWDTYSSVLDFAAAVQRDIRDLRPRDLIDIQSFIWVQGSDEYAK